MSKEESVRKNKERRKEKVRERGKRADERVRSYFKDDSTLNAHTPLH